MKNDKFKRLAVSSEVHKFVMLRVLESEEFKNVDDYLRFRFKI